MTTNHVRVGVGCLITSAEHPGAVLMGIRQGSHGAGKLALPGGHLELGESWETCAARETLEETNLTVENISFVYATNDPNIDNNVNKHYVTIFMHCSVTSDSGPLQLMEPEKCLEWKWFPWTEVHEILTSHTYELFDPMLHFLQQQDRHHFTP